MKGRFYSSCKRGKMHLIILIGPVVLKHQCATKSSYLPSWHPLQMWHIQQQQSWQLWQTKTFKKLDHKAWLDFQLVSSFHTHMAMHYQATTPDSDSQQRSSSQHIWWFTVCVSPRKHTSAWFRRTHIKKSSQSCQNWELPLAQACIPFNCAHTSSAGQKCVTVMQWKQARELQQREMVRTWEGNTNALYGSGKPHLQPNLSLSAFAD